MKFRDSGALNNFLKFLREFHSNSGTWILSATLINKFILFLIKVFVIVNIEKAVYGQITYAISVIMFFTPFVGLGSPAGLLRYGSIAKSVKERHNIINYSFSAGLIGTVLLMLTALPVVYFLSEDEKTPLLFFHILIIRILALFLNNHQSAQMRVDLQNKRYGQYDIMNSVILFGSALLFTWLFEAEGYLTALVCSPLVTFLIYSMVYGFPEWKLKFNFPFTKKEYWSYSVLTSFSSIVAQLIFLVDIYLIKMFLTHEAVAEYSVASLIPMNVLVLPHIFMRTDFTRLAANYKNRKFLKNYYINYLWVFFVLSVGGLLISYFMGEWMFGFLGNEYQPFEIFMYLMVAVCVAIMFRVPLGNMISAFGKAKFNTISGIFTLFISIILNLLLIPEFGLRGAAWATCAGLLISSLINIIYFIWYLKNECE